MKLKKELDLLKVRPLLISADPPRKNVKFRQSLSIPDDWPLLSDEDHAVADQYGIPISKNHPQARKYSDGFIQPAVFVYAGEEEVFTFVQVPKFTNLWGAARRPTPEQVLAEIRGPLGG